MSKTDKIEKLAAKKNSQKIIQMVNDKDPEIRLAAIHGLGLIGDEASQNTLQDLLRNQDADVRLAAVKSLGAIAILNGRDVNSKSHLQHLKLIEKDERVKKAIDEAVSGMAFIN